MNDLAVAREAAQTGAAVVQAWYHRIETADFKGVGNPVTEADRAAERAIRAVLREATPDIGILGEEYGEEGAPEGRRWLVDPIDGTIAFSRGVPLFGTLLALLEEGEPVLGLIDLPALDERTLGFRGGGVRRNGEPVRVSNLAADFLEGYTQFVSTENSHTDGDVSFEYSGTNGFTSRLSASSE